MSVCVCVSVLWACVAATGNISLVEEKTDFIKCRQILEANIKPSVKKLEMKSGWLLQQYNDPKHTSKSTMDYVKRHKVQAISVPLP